MKSFFDHSAFAAADQNLRPTNERNKIILRPTELFRALHFQDFAADFRRAVNV